MEALVIEPKIEYAQICSSNPIKALKSCYIGISSKKNIYEVLFKIPISQIPDNIDILSATLIIDMVSINPGYSASITPFALKVEWDLTSVQWENKPSFNPEICGESIFVKKASKCNIDITPIVKKWYKKEVVNYGIVLMSNGKTKNSIVKILNNQSPHNRPRVKIVYENKNPEVLNTTKFIEKVEEISTKDSYRYSTPRNTSLTKEDIFYIKNLGKNKITAHLQSSPDGISYINESDEICIERTEMKFLVSCIFSKFTRVAVKNINCGECSKVKIWYLAQE